MSLVWAIRGGILLLIVALFAWAMLLRGNAIDARAERDQAQAAMAIAVAANVQQAETITRLTALRASEDRILTELGDEIGKLNNAADEQTAAINELAGTNAAVKDFLATPLPSDLKRLLAN